MAGVSIIYSAKREESLIVFAIISCIAIDGSTIDFKLILISGIDRFQIETDPKLECEHLRRRHYIKAFSNCDDT